MPFNPGQLPSVLSWHKVERGTDGFIGRIYDRAIYDRDRWGECIETVGVEVTEPS
jgi:hypothetical protein